METANSMKLSRYVPILEWLPAYHRRAFRGDLQAGITVAVMLVPQGMAYAMLAGLQPIYGLYAGIVPLLLYAFFGTSRQLSVGPVALVSLLILAGVGALAERGSPEFIGLAISTALLAGLIQVSLGLFRLGFLVNFLSHPVITGFTSAAAFIIGFSQLGNLLGLSIPRSNYIHELVVHAVRNWQAINLPTLLLGLSGIALILILRKINRTWPGALIAVLIFTLIVWVSGLHEKGVEVVGTVPQGLPKFTIPTLNLDLIGDLAPLALTICLISFIESLAIAKTIEAKHKTYKVDANQELFALGLTKIGGAFFQSYPTTGSFTRSAVNNEAGAQTGVSSIISALLVALTLLFLTPLFYFLPKAILASIVVVAVLGLIGYKEAIALWRTDRRDFAMLLATFVATLVLGIQQGVAVGVLLSLALVIYRNSIPHVAVLGKLPDSDHYRNVSRFPRAEQDDHLLIVRFDAQLYFGNANYFKDNLEELAVEKGPQLRTLVLDASSMHDIDSSGLHALEEIVEFLYSRKVQLYITGAIGPVRDLLYKSGLMDRIGKGHHFLTVPEAVQHAETEAQHAHQHWKPEAVQTNIPAKRSK